MLSTPAKCTASVTRTSFILHFLGFLWYSGGVCYDRIYRNDIPVFQAFGGRFQFLTEINVYMTFVATAFAFFVDLLHMMTNWMQSDLKRTMNKDAKNSSLLIRIRDELISYWVYAGCTIVPVLYWGLIAIDKDAMHSDEMEKRTPLFGLLNQFLHTIPLLYAFVLITFVNYEYVSMLRMFFNSTGFAVGFLSWMSYCAKQNGYWSYPVVQKQSTSQFIVFTGVCIMVLILLQLLGRKWASMVWNQQRQDCALRSHAKKE